MDGSEVLILIAIVVVALFLILGVGAMLTRFYRKVDQGKALIINKLKDEPEVTFTGGVVFPVIHRAEVMDISVKTMEIDRNGKDGLICRDNIRADVKVTFFVRVNKTKDDVLKVAQAIGCVRASDQRTLEELFSAKFSEALKTVGKQLDFVDLYTKREDFKDQIIAVIGRDLNGYVLEDAAIDYLEQTPLSSLDPTNILDAQGIRKITELTAKEHISTNEHSNNEKKMIKKQDVETAEAVLELERQQADAEAKQKREIETIRARANAEIERVQAEELLKAESARIKTAEDLEVQEQNKMRQVEVAGKNRERVVGIETERVKKDRDLEAISREKAVELERIFKEKALEVERKEIQDVIRQRIIVEKAVAEEEEAIKAIRVVEEANRIKQSTIITAEGEAQEQLVKVTKAAEAGETAARFQAKQRIILAEAELEAADKAAQAKIRMAEGIQAEVAAEGLAAVKVKEADAIAHQKHGLAEATVTRELGSAQASAVQDKMQAEAAGIAEKAKSMKALDEAGRGHEEFRLRLEKEKDVELAAIQVQQNVAEAQLATLGAALEHADIDIVGGEGQFFDRIMNAVSYGKAAEVALKTSDTGKMLMRDYESGRKDLAGDLKEIVTSPALGSDDVRNLTLSALLAKLMTGADDERKAKIGRLVHQAREMGLLDQSN